jgi:hypothetical protein
VTPVTALLTNKAYGYPTRGARRRRKPTILACLHQTANARATAIQERNYANRAHSAGPSATAYIDKDGSIVRAILPGKYAAWSQGDVAHPNTKLPTARVALALRRGEAGGAWRSQPQRWAIQSRNSASLTSPLAIPRITWSVSSGSPGAGIQVRPLRSTNSTVARNAQRLLPSGRGGS